MWLFDEHGGFYSAVQDEKIANTMWVRTRDKETAERLSEWKRAGGKATPEVLQWKNRDYAYRVQFTKEDWAAYLQELVMTSMATNFKNEVASNLGYTSGRKFLRALTSIWQIMYDYQQDTKA